MITNAILHFFVNLVCFLITALPSLEVPAVFLNSMASASSWIATIVYYVPLEVALTNILIIIGLSILPLIIRVVIDIL